MPLRCRVAGFTSIRYGERLAELGAQPSVGSVGDSYDNALAETVNGLYKTELIYGPEQGPWRTVEAVELATLGWLGTTRSGGTATSTICYRQSSRTPIMRPAPPRCWLESTNPSLQQTRGGQMDPGPANGSPLILVVT